MFAADHAATALVIKRRFPSVPLTPILLSVQAMELAWVGLNYSGIERTTTEPIVRTVADIHLAYMPYSHSVVTGVGAALLAWLLVEHGFGRPLLGRAIGIGIVSHLLLDLITHAPDIALAPRLSSPQFGLGLYDRAPMWAFGLELVYGAWCWWVYRGSRSLLSSNRPRKPRQPHSVFGGDCRTRTVSGRPAVDGRHTRLWTDRHHADTGRLAGKAWTA